MGVLRLAERGRLARGASYDGEVQPGDFLAGVFPTLVGTWARRRQCREAASEAASSRSDRVLPVSTLLRESNTLRVGKMSASGYIHNEEGITYNMHSLFPMLPLLQCHLSSEAASSKRQNRRPLRQPRQRWPEEEEGGD